MRRKSLRGDGPPVYTIVSPKISLHVIISFNFIYIYTYISYEETIPLVISHNFFL